MSVEHPPLERLSELVDGDLAPDVAASVERHVAACVTCRANLARVRDLVERAAGLPAVIDPPAEAWTALRARLPEHRPVVHRGRARHRARDWGLLAAAALVLVAGSSAITAVALRSRGSATVSGVEQGAPAPAVSAVPEPVAAVERSYAGVVDELTRTLTAQRGTLAPSTIATLERTLRVIDEAIAEARAALAADPGNDALVDVLSANYEQKIELLRRATELPART